jgi:CHASE2 domain-containing sensor protein
VTGPFTRKKSLLNSALGAALTVAYGLILWGTPLGDFWTNASYDYGFRFGTRPVTNAVTLILMDNAAFDQFHQTRGEPWSRTLHAQLLNKLADDGCELVAMDSFFRATNNLAAATALADAMRRQRHLVLMAEQSSVTHPGLAGAAPTLPAELFSRAAQTNWGVAWLNPDLDGIVRRHWPFPSPGPFPSLPQTAARLAGAKLGAEPQEHWLRYYGSSGAWTRMSYQFALAQPTNYFRNQIVFIGTQPKTSLPDGETDEFATPDTRWTGEASGGVEILLAEFLNLLNDESLQRPSAQLEISLLTLAGIFLGGGLWRLRLRLAFAVATGIFLAVAVTGICLSYYSNFWFPWFIVAGGQLPCALAWALAINLRRAPVSVQTLAEDLPATPGYELFSAPFAQGAYGTVWLARNRAGQWRALKVVYLAKFENDPDPYEREYAGIKKYQPISDRHPGLLRVEFVSEKTVDYFYYVMELADSIVLDWEKNPAIYKPRDLVSARAELRGRRLPVKDCVRHGLTLCAALEFIHQSGLTHRDIKPQNIIFVNGQPKLADLGLITGLRPLGHEGTLVGTPGFMPPSPERPGTVAADIYALGMVLYVLCTGRAAALFPEVATTLVSTEEPPEFLPLNTVILKACAPLPTERFISAAAMRTALENLLVSKK